MPHIQSTSLPSTSEFLAYHALRHPKKIAVSWNRQDWTYHEIFHDLARVTQALEKLGLSTGQFALIYQPNPYIHVLLLLACENLGITTSSLPEPGPTILFSKANFIFSSTPVNAPIPVYLMDSQWLASALSMPINKSFSESASVVDMESTVRVSRSSGTTGVPKIMRFNRRQFELWIQAHTRGKRLSEKTVLMVTYGFEVFAIWGQVAACLRKGGTVLAGNLSLMSTRFGITCLWLLPTDLLHLLQKPPEGWKKQPGLLIYTGGAPLPDSLRSKAVEHFCDDIVNAYGTNEAGGICELDGANVGVLKPGLEVKVVDDDGNSLEIGQEGLLAFRSPVMILAYWEQPEYTDKYFRDGWFYPGDRGKLISPRVLQHLGRDDEMLNLGGIKQAPETIERFFLSLPSVTEAAATSLPSDDGVDDLLVALVLKDPSVLPRVQQAAKTQLASVAKRMHILSCERLPRTPNGKIQRMAIRDFF